MRMSVSSSDLVLSTTLETAALMTIAGLNAANAAFGGCAPLKIEARAVERVQSETAISCLDERSGGIHCRWSDENTHPPTIVSAAGSCLLRR